MYDSNLFDFFLFLWEYLDSFKHSVIENDIPSIFSTFYRNIILYFDIVSLRTFCKSPYLTAIMACQNVGMRKKEKYIVIKRKRYVQ